MCRGGPRQEWGAAVPPAGRCRPALVSTLRFGVSDPWSCRSPDLMLGLSLRTSHPSTVLWRRWAQVDQAVPGGAGMEGRRSAHMRWQPGVFPQGYRKQPVTGMGPGTRSYTKLSLARGWWNDLKSSGSGEKRLIFQTRLFSDRKQFYKPTVLSRLTW